MNKLVILSEQKSFVKRPISHDAILGQETEFLQYGKDNVEIKYKSFVLKNINRVISKIGIQPIADSFAKQKRNDCVFMYIAMHLSYLKTNLYLLNELKKAGNKIALYVWDCWEPEFDEWQEVLDDLRPDYILKI